MRCHSDSIAALDLFAIFTLCSIFCEADEGSSYIGIDRDRRGDLEVKAA
jgi:hypothetical protein